MGTHIFDTPYDAGDPLNGQEVIITRTFSALYRDEPAPMHTIQFNNGTTLEVWPEEIREKD